MEYKGFYGTVEYSKEDNIFHGKIENISDLVTYEAEKKDELENSFKEAVEDYVETCNELGKNLEKQMELIT